MALIPDNSVQTSIYRLRPKDNFPMFGDLLAISNDVQTIQTATNTLSDIVAAIGNVTKLPARLAATGNVNLASSPATFDGIAAANGDRIFLPLQTTGSQNGVYVFTAAAAPLVRSTDMDESSEVKSGMMVIVTAGNTNSGSLWELLTPDPITINVTSLNFQKITAQVIVGTTPISGGIDNRLLKQSGGLMTNSLLFDNGTSLGIGTATPSASSIFELSSTTKGFLAPRMTTVQRDAIAAPAIGLILFNTTTALYNFYDGVSWKVIETSAIGFINGGNAFGVDASFGLTDNHGLDILTNNISRINISAAGEVGIGIAATPVDKLLILSTNPNVNENALNVEFSGTGNVHDVNGVNVTNSVSNTGFTNVGINGVVSGSNTTNVFLQASVTSTGAVAVYGETYSIATGILGLGYISNSNITGNNINGYTIGLAPIGANSIVNGISISSTGISGTISTGLGVSLDQGTDNTGTSLNITNGSNFNIAHTFSVDGKSATGILGTITNSVASTGSVGSNISITSNANNSGVSGYKSILTHTAGLNHGMTGYYANILNQSSAFGLIGYDILIDSSGGTSTGIKGINSSISGSTSAVISTGYYSSISNTLGSTLGAIGYDLSIFGDALGGSNIGHNINIGSTGTTNTGISLNVSTATTNNAIDIIAGNINLADSIDFILSSVTGTKFGTATTQKIGFWNATPIVKGASYTVSNGTPDRSYNAAATSLNEMANVVAAIISDLQAVGLLG